MSIIGSNILAGASGQGGGYTIENSLRLRSSASAYLNRTPASAGNRKTWTWSAWVKRGTLSVNNQYLLGTPFNGATGFRFNSNDTFYFTGNGSTQFDFNTTQVFRDSSAWYHIVIAFDTTQATSSNRVKFYVNGVQITAFNTATYPSLNLDGQINAADVHRISHVNNDAGTNFDGYLAEVNFVDGQALDPSSFGEYNEDTGVWQPAAYAGTYGTNGFYLPFSDATTTTTLAADSSGNGNDWTPNNISLTSGGTYDSMTDTPTIYAGGGNYCTLSPIFVGRGDAGGTYGATNGNLTGVNIGAGGWAMMGSTMVIPAASGKYYFECTVGAAPQSMSVGVQKAGTPFAAPYIVGYVGDANGYSYANDGYKFNNGSSAYGSTATANDVIGVAIDASGATSSIEFYKNGVSMGVAFTGITGGLMPAISTTAVAGNCHMNFGQRPFAYTPPTDFLPLHTGNLPDSTIVDGSQYMDMVLYTAATADGTYTEGNLSFRPDFSWIKNRNNAERHFLSDVVRGNTSITDKFLVSNSTAAEGANGVSGTTFSVTDTGYEFVETSINTGELFFNGRTYVGWNWKANGAGVLNEQGSIDSTVSANPTAGFSIVTYTGTGANATVGHGLGAAPSMIMVKNRDSGAVGGAVYHASLGATKYLKLFQTTTGTDRDATDNTAWNGGSPTFDSDVFSVGSLNRTNSSAQMVAYCFSEVEGYSKFGSYTGNGSSDGVFVYLGFRPALVLTKRSDSTGPWVIYDATRDLSNDANTALLYPYASDAEYSQTGGFDLLSNGFKIRASTNIVDYNASGGTYIYMAFAENPFKNSLAR